MRKTYYEPGEQRAARVSELFERIAPRYDLINDLQSFGLHRLWKRRLVKLANPKPGEGALDICCGTGDMALALARQGAQVVGLDFSGPMLAVAGRRLEVHRRRRGSGCSRLASASSIQFLRGDAERMPFPDAHFDIVTVGYGLRNLEDWRSGLQEMQRVARPGGRLLVLDFGKPDRALWRGLYFAYLRYAVPVLGKICCGDAQAYAYILESLDQYPAQRGVAAQMQEMKCQDVRVIHLLGGVMSINYGRKAVCDRP